MPQPFRTFVAVEAGEAVRREVAKLIARLRLTQAKVRWTALDQLHFTMAFLGDVDGPMVSDICRAVSEAVADVPEFDVDVAGLGAFPDFERARTLWVGARSGVDEMVELQGRIAAALDRLGFRPEARRFTPHLTIGRVRSIPRGDRSLVELLRKDAEFVGGLMTVDEAVVFSSVLTREGPQYEPLGHAELRRG